MAAIPGLLGTATETMNSTSAWFALAGAFGGVLITSAVGLVTAILNHRWLASATSRKLQWEHTKQLRQERLEIYARYWSAWNRLTQLFLVVKEDVLALEPRPSTSTDAKARINPNVAAEVQAAATEWREAYNTVFLIGGRDVIDALIKHRKSTDRRLENIWQGEYATDPPTHIALTDAMRTEITDPPKP